MASKIDFFALPRPVQERFAASTRHAAPPRPLLYRRASRRAVWAHLAAAGVLVALEALLLTAGWGDMRSPLALHGTKWLLVDGLLLAGAAYGVLHAVGLLLALESLPYRPGIYLFPGCAVDARGPVLQVWDVSDAKSVEQVGLPSPGLALAMRDGSRVVIPARSVKEAERAERKLESLRERLAVAMDRGDSHGLADLDPLHDSAMSNPIGPTEVMKRRVSAWTRVDWAIALVVGLALGHALGTTRNSISDDAMYRAVVVDDNAASYRLYLARGGRHREEVEQTLLPKTELREAEAQQSVSAVQSFAAEHPSSKIAPEINAALRRSLLAELEKAKQPGTVTALDAFAHRFPLPLVAPEWGAARHALYARALEAAKKRPRSESAAALWTRLIGWAEKNGPAAEIRFQITPSTSMDDADASVRRSSHFPGVDALPSRYVSVDALRPREQRVADAIAQGVAALLPADVFTMHAGERLAPDAELPPGTALVVSYATEWSHATTACTKPETAFAGLIFVFEASVVVPDGKPPLKVTVKSWRGAESWKVRPEGRAREEFEQKVYDLMIDGAFDQLAKRLSDILL